MSSALTDGLLFLSAFLGFIALLLAMPRHHKDWLDRSLPPKPARAGRWAGFLLLAVSLVLACTGHGWDYGLVALCGWWTLAAALVVAIHCNRSRIRDAFGRRGR